MVDMVSAFEAEGYQAAFFAVLGHKADLGVMVLGPDLVRIQEFESALNAGPLVPVWSYVSLTELSEYTSTLEDERTRLQREEGLQVSELEERLSVWQERMQHYSENRLYPCVPRSGVVSFYPMSKSRDPGANWYELSFEERKSLMGGHARIGRNYAGRVLQLITGSTGLDDWEWGVSLFVDDPVVLKEIVSEMRFDPVSARYGQFGPFFIGVLGEIPDVLSRIGVSDRGDR